MGQSRKHFGQSQFWLSAWITAALGLATCTLIPWLLMALERDDVEASESALMLAVARQLTHGPRELYGPYDSSNLLVLIHAPLYYRLAALAAWPIARTGTDAETAARIAGRALSLAGWVAMLAGAFVLARVPRTPRVAGWWAVLLAAATPVYGGLPFEVRPDMIGIALQTWGVILVFSSLSVQEPSDTRKTQVGIEPHVWLRRERPADLRKILLAFTCFALAGCVKQHLVVASGVAVYLLVGARAQGRLGWKAIGGALLLDAIILLSYYGFEEWATAGRMSRSMLAAKEASLIHPSTWPNAGEFMLVLCWKCVGLILLLAAAALAAVSARGGLWRRLLTTAGTGLVGLVAGLAIVQIFAVTPAISNLIVLGLVATMVCFAPITAFALKRAWQAGEIDPALAFYLACELALSAYLVRQSTGAWYNYTVQGMFFASVLAARVLARAVERPLPARAVVAVALAVLAVPAFALTDAKETLARRRAESVLIGRLFERVDANADSVFFAGRPGLNRVHGRADLVYDPWLYPVFESMGLARPRSAWLARALETGPVKVIVTSVPQSRIDGIPRELPELGYTLRMRLGPWLVWTRKPRPAGPALRSFDLERLPRPTRSIANPIS
jgi:hypothetical protein